MDKRRTTEISNYICIYYYNLPHSNFLSIYFDITGKIGGKCQVNKLGVVIVISTSVLSRFILRYLYRNMRREFDKNV